MPENDEYDSNKPFLIKGKALERHFELQDALFEFSSLFRHDEPNDRAIAIIGAAFLDTLLENILISFLVDDEKEIKKLLQYEQPLGTYGNRVRLAYCLGLIGKIVRDDLRHVGKIRNKFAHDLYASFEDEKIAASCRSLQWHRISYMQPPAEASARALFQVGVNRLVTYLNPIPSLARSEKRTVMPDS